MKIMLEHEHADEKTTPINIAQAIINFTIAGREDEKGWQEDFMEIVDYLNVYVNHMKRRHRLDVF